MVRGHCCAGSHPGTSSALRRFGHLQYCTSALATGSGKFFCSGVRSALALSALALGSALALFGTGNSALALSALALRNTGSFVCVLLVLWHQWALAIIMYMFGTGLDGLWQ
jgi:hypothetical protein